MPELSLPIHPGHPQLSEGREQDERADGLEREVRELRDLIEASAWVGRPLRGGLPSTPVRDTLPTAASEFAYQFITIRGTPDITYQCLRNSGGTWGWRTVATG